MAKNRKTYFTVLTFLILEVLAFVSFTLTNSVILYAIASFGLVFAIVFVEIDKIKLKDFSPIGLVLIPLVIFAILNAVSSFNGVTNGTSLALLSSIGLLSFFTLGYLSSHVEAFKMSKGIVVIYSAIAVLVILSLILTFISYVPFYTWTYANSFIYYQGSRISIGDSVKFLFGFDIKDISVEYFHLFAVTLFSSVVGLRFLNPKTQTREFILFAFFALIGFVAMLFTINKLNIVTSTLVILFCLFVAFYPKKGKAAKVLNYAFYGVVGIVCILGLIFILNALKVSFISDVIASNSILDKIFNSNRISVLWVEIIQKSFSFDNILGLTPKFTNDVISSGNIFLDMFEITGWIGGVSFIVFIVLAFKGVIKYFNKSSDDNMTKHLIIGFLGTFFIYSFFAYDLTPMKDGMTPFTVLPIQFNGLFMIVMFILGYIFIDNKNNVLEVKVEEQSVVIEEEVITYEE